MLDNNIVIQRVSHKIVSKVNENLGNIIKRIILYGSCARGDFSIDSDIDVMLLLDCPHDELSKYRRMTSSIASEISLDENVEVSLLLEDIYTFDKWLDTIVFYQNVEREGIVLYE